jgi:hypothetical protein
MKKYESLKQRYPEYISLDQLYRICRISKKSALYLVQNGIIPFLDTGKKTWKYKIALSDVITYLRRREQVGSMIPRGAASSRHNRPHNQRKSFSEYVLRGEEHKIAEYFKYIFADYPDVLTIADISEMTGFCKETIRRYIRFGEIKPFEVSRKWYVPKPCFLEFVASQSFIDCKSNTETLKKVLGGFELWKTAQS